MGLIPIDMIAVTPACKPWLPVSAVCMVIPYSAAHFRLLFGTVKTLPFLVRRYSYYDQIVSLRMLPLQRMVLWTQRLRAEIFRTASGDSRIVFAGA